MGIQFLLLVLLGVIGIVIGYLFRRRQSRQLREISDREFLECYNLSYSSEGRDILAARRRIASILGIPQLKLSPRQSLAELSKRFEFLGEFSVGWSDLDNEVRELRRERGGDEDAELPATICELIAELTG